MFRRTLLFKVFANTPPEKVTEFEGIIRQLPDHIKELIGLSLGRNLDPAQLFTHVWDMDFSDPENVLETYHPNAFKQNSMMPFFKNSNKIIVERQDHAYYRRTASETRSKANQRLLRQVILFQAPGASNGFEEMLRESASKEPNIMNWAVNSTAEFHKLMPNPWTHVLELEFAADKDFERYRSGPRIAKIMAPTAHGGEPLVQKMNQGWYWVESSLILKSQAAS